MEVFYLKSTIFAGRLPSAVSWPILGRFRNTRMLGLSTGSDLFIFDDVRHPRPVFGRLPVQERAGNSVFDTGHCSCFGIFFSDMVSSHVTGNVWKPFRTPVMRFPLFQIFPKQSISGRNELDRTMSYFPAFCPVSSCTFRLSSCVQLNWVNNPGPA